VELEKSRGAQELQIGGEEGRVESVYGGGRVGVGRGGRRKWGEGNGVEGGVEEEGWWGEGGGEEGGWGGG